MNSENKELSDSPYKGLDYYTKKDAAKFFGRKEWRKIILDNLMAGRVTLLYGESGVGKSSVLDAGVVSKLTQMAEQNKNEFGTPKLAVAMFRSWSDNPCNGLVECVQDAAIDALKLSEVEAKTVKELMPPFSTLTEALQAWAKCVGGRLYIILDQFEEYFLYQPKIDSKHQFVLELSQAVNNPDLHAHFLISIRDESYAKLDRLKVEIPNLFNRDLRIERLDWEAGKEAIERPILEYYNKEYAQQFNIDPGLSEAILKDVEVIRASQWLLGEAGLGEKDIADNQEKDIADNQEKDIADNQEKDIADNQEKDIADNQEKDIADNQQKSPKMIETSCLQLVMDRLWEEEKKHDSQTLRLKTYEELGRAEQIVKEHVNQQMKELSSQQQNTAACIFHYLVTRSRTKIAHTISELVDLVNDEPDRTTQLTETQVESVLKQLCQQKVRILRPLLPASREQQEARYEIFHDVLAPAILDWRRKYLEEVERAKRAEEEQAERAERIRKKWLVARVGGLILLVVVLTILSIVNNLNNHKKELQQSLELALPGESQLDKLLAAMSAVNSSQESDFLFRHIDQNQKYLETLDKLLLPWTMQKSLESLREQNHFKRDRKAVWSENININDPLRTLYVTISQDGIVSLWNLQKKEPLAKFKGNRGEVKIVWFSPDDKLLATISKDGTVHLWDLQSKSQKPLAEFKDDASPVQSINFSPDGQKLATGSADGTIRLWDLQDKELLKKTLAEFKDDASLVQSINFSPDGQKLATGSADGTIRLWDLQGKLLKKFPGNKIPIYSISFNPTGQKLAIGSADGTVQLWDLQGNQLAEFKGHTKTVWNVSFRSDGKRLATASADGTARLWDLQSKSQKPLAEFEGHRDEVLSAKFSPDDKNLITASKDGTIRFWNFQPPELELSPNDRQLAELVKTGCDWLKDYLNTHPEEQKNLPCSASQNNAKQ
jgi:WD40 repeat protein